jgi:hypothetical protein
MFLHDESEQDDRGDAARHLVGLTPLDDEGKSEKSSKA